ncbi:MAG: hypothetical protein RB191_12490 [Terriglobia bacterium]|nr:hypothetical protein [Terriglobia bacterium]
MANTYNWSVIPTYMQQMTVDGTPLAGVYVTLDWRLGGSDGETPEHYADVYGQLSLSPPDPASFVPQSSVTTADIIGWLTAALGSEQITKLKATVDAKIALMQSPPTATAPAITAAA